MTIQLEYNYNDVPPISSAYHCYTTCRQVWDSLPDRGFENAPSNLDKSADLHVRNQLRPSVLPGISEFACHPAQVERIFWGGWVGEENWVSTEKILHPPPPQKKKKIFLPNRFRHHRNPPTAALNFGTRFGLWLSRWFPKPATPRWDGWVRRVAFSNHDKAMAMRVFYLVASGKR